MVNRNGQINDRLSKDSDMLKKENMDQIDKMEKFNRKLESTKQSNGQSSTEYCKTEYIK